MNQILSMDPNNSGFGNNYNNMNMNGGNNGGGGKLDTKTTKRIFAIAMIVFGLVMFIGGLVGTINSFSVPQATGEEYPIISTMQNDNILTLSVKNNVPIDVIEYSWNNGRISEIAGNNTLEIVREITVPQGQNILTLNIKDVNGNTITKSNSFIGIEVEDTTKPEIDVVVVGSRLNISAKSISETKLSYLTYKWNDEQEIRIEATGDQMSIDTTVDVLNGTNKLTIVAVNEKGISNTQVDEYIGVKKPVIEVKKDESGERLQVTITHDEAVKSADIVFNGKKVSLTADHFGKPEVKINLRLVQGTNTIQITAVSVNDAVETYNGTTTK